MKYIKKFAAFLLSLTVLLGAFPALLAHAEVAWPSDISISADGGIVMDARSGAILYEKNSQEAYYPASITKMLTALIIIENCDLDDMVTFSHTAVNTLEPNATIVGARTGDQMSVRDCLYALLLQSANEVANALAEHCSGSIENFAELMNRKAESLGCVNSHFSNPSGLNSETHYTCAYDMALIAKAAFENPTFVEIDSTTYYDVQPGQLQQYPDGWRYYAHHQMLKKNNSHYYEGIIGGKTGYTSLAGNTLVTCAERDGLKLIAVVLNGHQTHYEDTKSMLDFGFNNFKSVAIADQDSTYEKVENDLTIAEIFPGTATRLSIAKDSVITLPNNGDFADVTSVLDYSLSSSTPNSAVASINYMYGDHMVGQAYLEAATAYGYIAGSSEEPVSAADSGAVSTIEVTGKSTEGETVTASPAASSEETEEPASPSPVFAIVIRVVSVIAGLAILGAIVFGILSWRERKEQNERMLRRQRREKRLREWGYSSSEFDQIMEQHLRERTGGESRGRTSKKKSPFDRFR